MITDNPWARSYDKIVSRHPFNTEERIFEDGGFDRSDTFGIIKPRL